MLSLKLAANNIKKGFKSFAPFLMASITMFVMIFVTASIALSPSIHKLKGGESLSQIMGFALIVLSIFAVLILIYSSIVSFKLNVHENLDSMIFLVLVKRELLV